MATAFVRKKSASLCFRGFVGSPLEVEARVGRNASLILEKGKPVRVDVKTLATKSAVSFELEFPANYRLAEMIPELIVLLGGVNHLLKVRDIVKPEYFEINFTLPVKNSEAREGGALDPETIADVARLGASISFSFL